MNTQEYIISGGQEGKSRLNVLSHVLHVYTKELLERNGLKAGMAMLDLGSGGGNVATMASSIVGEEGSVTAIDFDEKIIALAQIDAEQAGYKNLTFRVQSAYDIGFDQNFDIAYGRFLLSHLDKPLDVLEKMVQSIKPGGRVVVEDIEFRGHFCYPACAAFNKYLKYYELAAKYNGADANIGPSLYALFRQAGMYEVGFDVIQPCFSTGDGKWMGYITLEKIKPALIKQGVASASEIDNMLEEVEAFTKDEQTIISLPRIFRVWGTRK